MSPEIMTLILNQRRRVGPTPSRLVQKPSKHLNERKRLATKLLWEFYAWNQESGAQTLFEAEASRTVNFDNVHNPNMNKCARRKLGQKEGAAQQTCTHTCNPMDVQRTRILMKMQKIQHNYSWSLHVVGSGSYGN